MQPLQGAKWSYEADGEGADRKIFDFSICYSTLTNIITKT
jgi:hypothetical protein